MEYDVLMEKSKLESAMLSGAWPTIITAQTKALVWLSSPVLWDPFGSVLSHSGSQMKLTAE